MTSSFLQHQWKAFWRSKNTGKSIAVRIVMALLILYLLVNVLVLAFFLDKIFKAIYPAADVIRSFNSFLLYYFLLDLLARFQLQELPTLSVKPYLNLPVRKNQIVNYLCLTSLWSGFNLTPFLLTLPFLIKVVIPSAGGAVFTAYVVTLLGLTMFNHFFSLWLKRKVNLNGWYMLAFLLFIAVVSLLDFKFKAISISSFSVFIFNQLLVYPLYMLLPVLLATGMYLVNYRFLRSNLYLDELRSDSSGEKSSTEIPFLNRFGMAGQLTVTELKLILRNKRSKSSLTICSMMMLYGLLFYTNPALGSSYGWKIFASLFMTGIFIINYGQFMFSWQSSHFDGILAHRITTEDFIKSKFILFTIFSGIAFILTIPYVFFGWQVLFVQFCMFFWNLGVNTLVVLFFANRNYRRIDLSKGGSFNWEGVGASQWLLSLPLFILPYVIFVPLNYLGYPLIAITLMGFVGLVFIITRTIWINMLVKNFKKQRYLIAEGFRHS